MNALEAGDDKVSILLVDGQDAGRLTLEAALEPLGQRLVHARSGREALRHLLHQDFALVLMDVVVPDMDGFETAQLIRERERSRDTPILFLSGTSRGQPEQRAYAAGAVDFLYKPYKPEILRSKVRVFVDLFRKRELARRQGEALAQAWQVGPALLAPHVARLEALERDVARLSRRVDGLLALTRLDAGRREPGEVDLAEVVREVAARFAEEAARARCPLTVRAEHAVVGPWERVRMEQVVTNLLSNALQYGTGQPVELVVGSEGGQATLEVRDRGIGIPAEHHPRLFERFERAVPHGTVAGFGLGLWLVRQIVNGLGGSVGVESAPGRGSTFRVLLPRAGEPLAEDGSRAAGA